MVWKMVKILWGIFCLLCLALNCVSFYQVQKHPWFYKYIGIEVYAFFILWFAVGFLFCLLQNKSQNFERSIKIHLYFTLVPLFLICLLTFFLSCSQKFEEFFRN